MAPLSKEIRPISSSTPPHLGPATPEVNSVWFKFFIYTLTGYGPPSILLSKGTRLKQLPRLFKNSVKILVTTWGHDPTILPISDLVFTVNEALCHSAVLVQSYGETCTAETILVPFPMSDMSESKFDWSLHPAIKKLSENIDLKHNCGFLTMVNLNQIDNQSNTYFKKVSYGSNNSVVSSWIESQINNTKNDSEFVSPVNGIINQEFVDILEEELDNLGDVKNQEITPKNLLENNKNDNEVELLKWTLLDCDFGIPLFNAKTNEEVCGAICKHKLWDKTSLEELKESSQILSSRLLDFIHNLQDNPTISDFKLGETNKPLPTLFPKRSLMFHSGSIELWNN